MNAIGGYFGLELTDETEYHSKGIRLNTGRNALEYIFIAKKYTKIYLPYYSCQVLLEPVTKHNITYEYYGIDENFEAQFDFSKIQNEECFLYTNYYGLKDNYVSSLSKKCKNLIIDNAQAFYAKPIAGIDTFYSPRKFFGVPDGAYLYTDKNLEVSLSKDISYNRFEHLLRRIDISAEDGYPAFINNDESLKNLPIMGMSNLTTRLLSSINYENIAAKRKDNYNFLHKNLKKSNELNIEINTNQVPMVYPFYSTDSSLRKKLVDRKIYTALYWPNVLKQVNTDCIEYRYALHLFHLPVDQRYNETDLLGVIDLLLQ